MPAKASATLRSLNFAGVLMALVQPAAWAEATAPAHPDQAGHEHEEEVAQDDNWHRLQDWVIGLLGASILTPPIMTRRDIWSPWR